MQTTSPSVHGDVACTASLISSQSNRSGGKWPVAKELSLFTHTGWTPDSPNDQGNCLFLIHYCRDDLPMLGVLCRDHYRLSRVAYVGVSRLAQILPLAGLASHLRIAIQNIENRLACTLLKGCPGMQVVHRSNQQSNCLTENPAIAGFVKRFFEQISSRERN